MMPYGGIFFWGLILIAVVVLITLLARKGSKGSESSISSQETALDILKKRYARGELTKEEFERIKQDIQ
jgi:putative membrane protein